MMSPIWGSHQRKGYFFVSIININDIILIMCFNLILDKEIKLESMIILFEDLNNCSVTCTYASNGAETCTNKSNGNWYTHPAFTFGILN